MPDRVTATEHVSVCMATHNGARFVREQIATILPQLDPADELVVVDDASSDNTAELVAGIADKRIRLIRLAENVGYVRAFERALTEARNDVLFLSDQDDMWLPGRVQAMRDAMVSHAVVAGNLTTLNGPQNIPGPYGQRDWRLDPADSSRAWRNTFGMLAGNRPYFGSAMGLHRDALSVVLPFPEYLRESHDLWIALCGMQLGSLIHLEQAVTARRYHGSNQTPERPRALPAVIRSRLLLIKLLGEARKRTHQPVLIAGRNTRSPGTIVDILIPYWGDPGYMKLAVDSVMAQDCGEWRLTVVDDAYPGTEIADYLNALDDSRVTYVRLDVNVGITENFRQCVARATAELAVILGCDDRLLPNYVRHVLAAHEAFPQAAIIQPGVRVIDETGAVVKPLVDRVKQDLVRPRGRGYRVLGGESLAANLLSGDWLYWPSLAFRTDRLRATPFRDGYPVTQDLALIMDLVFSGEQLLVFEEPCFEYRRHGDSASSLDLLDGSRFAAERAYFAVAADIAQSLGWGRAVLAARARLTSRAHAFTLMPRALIQGDFRTALDLARHGLGS